MPTEIVVTAGDLKLHGFLNDSPTARALAEALPITGNAQLWGEEIYFPVPQVAAALDDTDRKSTRLNSSHGYISYAVFCLKKKTKRPQHTHSDCTEECRHNVTCAHHR